MPLTTTTPPLALSHAGYSFSHVAPVLHGHVVNYGVKRISVGGRLLTNHLKELISFRSFNMMDEVLLMNDVKERSCFCSLDYNADMALARCGLTRDVVMCID
jgi:actin-related protein 6